ncbi:MAG: OmpH family outer membrane protein [Myxococcales bacterium]|nr:OmpH family outer membrane protein [Myxococcales bacterium]
MKVHRAIVLLGLAAVLAWGTGAQDEPLKLGIVDIDQAIQSTSEGKAAREELARKQREAEAVVQPLIERMQEMREDFQAKRFVISDEARFQKQLDLAEVQNEIESKVAELKGQLQVDEQRLKGPLLAKLGEIIEELGKEKGFTMILRRGTPGLLYAREALDVTDLVIEKYNQKQ